jgi:hypothetical protein
MHGCAAYGYKLLPVTFVISTAGEAQLLAFIDSCVAIYLLHLQKVIYSIDSSSL